MKKMRKISILLILFLSFQLIDAQKSKLNIYTRDIDNFWIAFDSIKRTNDEQKKLDIIQKLYLDHILF